MISDAKTATVSERYQTDTLSPKVIELRKKIRDEEYLESAIQRIAQVLSSKLVENAERMRSGN